MHIRFVRSQDIAYFRGQVLRKTLARRIGSLLIGGCLAGTGLSAHAGGFALIEQGASGLGNAYAGASAVSHDASTIWFNPAGMTELNDRDLAVALHVLRTDTDYQDEGSALDALVGGADVTGPESASPGTTALLPNLYYAARINERLSYGLGISVPFGSSTEYEDDWRGRYTTIESGVQVIDINPSIAYRVSERWRLGGGISIQQLEADLVNAFDSGAVCLSVFGTADPATCINAGLTPGNQANDSLADLTGDSTAVTFNLGALFLPTPDTRLGVAYRHSITHELDIDADFTVNTSLAEVTAGVPPVVSRFADQGAEAEIELPAMLSLSVAHHLNNRLELLGDITWTGWSSFQELRVEFDNDTSGTGDNDSVSAQEWEDVYRISAGVNYAQSEKLTLRFGLAYDEEPIPSPQLRTARIPGNDRTWVAFGLGYQISQRASVDFGYTHLFLDETPIDNANTETEGGMTVRGLFEPAVDILSAQFNWTFL